MVFDLKTVMMKVMMWITNIFLFLTSCNYLPPRTAYKVARIQSNLRIENSFKVSDFTEEYSFTGEGIINIVFQLNEKEVETLEASCKEKGYKKVTVENLIDDGFLEKDPKMGMNLYNRDIQKIDNGYYRLVARDLYNMDFGITILDISKKELIIYVSMP